MDKKDKNIETVLGQALELQAKGVSLPSIIRTYPEHEAEISQMLSAVGALEMRRQSIVAPEEGLRKILAALPSEQAPTTQDSMPSPYAAISTFWEKMQHANWKYVVPVLAVAILTAGGLLVQKRQAPTDAGTVALTAEDTENQAGKQVAIAPTVSPMAKSAAGTGPASSDTSNPADTSGARTAPMAAMMLAAPKSEVDEALDAFTAVSMAESSVATKSIAPKDVVTSDTKAVGDPATSYEKNF